MNLKERHMRRLMVLSEKLDREDEWDIPPSKLVANPDNPEAVRVLTGVRKERWAGLNVKFGRIGWLHWLALVLVVVCSIASINALTDAAAGLLEKIIMSLTFCLPAIMWYYAGPSPRTRRRLEKLIRQDEILVMPKQLQLIWDELCIEQHMSSLAYDSPWSYVCERYFSVLRPHVPNTRHQVFNTAGAKNQYEITYRAKGVMRPIIEELRAERAVEERAAATERQLAAERAAMLTQARQADLARQLAELPNSQDIRGAFNQE